MASHSHEDKEGDEIEIGLHALESIRMGGNSQEVTTALVKNLS